MAARTNSAIPQSDTHLRGSKPGPGSRRHFVSLDMLGLETKARYLLEMLFPEPGKHFDFGGRSTCSESSRSPAVAPIRAGAKAGQHLRHSSLLGFSVAESCALKDGLTLLLNGDACEQWPFWKEVFPQRSRALTILPVLLEPSSARPSALTR